MKNLGVDTDEGEGSGFSERKVVQGGRGFSSGGSPQVKAPSSRAGVEGGDGMWPAAQVLGLFALSITALGMAPLSSSW